MILYELLAIANERKASDLHLSAGLPPIIRVDGALYPFDSSPLTHDDVLTLIYSVMNAQQQASYEANDEIDFSFGEGGDVRFRMNAFHQARGAAASLRLIPSQILSMDELKLPSVFRQMMQFSHGLVLITGPTGCGKSTTLAAMVDFLNQTRQAHILTIEDPIEFIHTPKRCLVNQREVHRDTQSFSSALKSALREDPDIILVGEMRDLETIRLAMTAAETGHLVLATLHTSSATKSIDRIIDVFSGEDKAIIRAMLSESLRAVISQRLVKRIGGGRVPAFEIMICNAAIRNLIRENKISHMPSILQTHGAQGMQTLEQHLLELVRAGVISSTEGKIFAADDSFF